MGRPKRAADGGLLYRVLNRANARMTIFDKKDDDAALERVLEEAAERTKTRQAVLLRYDSAGQNDGTTFDDVSSEISDITAVAIQPQAGGFDIVVAGLGIGGSRYAVARYDSDGGIDTTFGNDGTASLGPGTWTNPPSKLLVQPDGDVVLVGIEPVPGSTTDDDLVVARFTADGQPDDSFNGDGIVTQDLGVSPVRVTRWFKRATRSWPPWRSRLPPR